MRIPVILNDFVRWANSGSIPYMCDRNKYIPECCNMGLADVNKYFDTKEFPCLTGVSKDEKAFRSLFRKQYNLTFPGINIPAFWARSISILGVPDHVYTDTYCLSYLASGWKWENIGLSEDHLSLLALVVISIKLRYGSVGDDGIFDISIKINSEPCMPFTHMLYNKNIIDTLSIDDRMQYVQEYASKAIKGLNLETASGEKNIVKVIDSHIKYNPLKESEETPPCEQQVEALSDASKYAIIEKRDMAMIGRNYNRLLAKCVLFLGCDVKTFRHAILTIEKRIHWKKQWVLSFID